MAQPYVGEIEFFGFTFAPRGWALCQGQILPINQNQALFSLLGVTYGGNGISTFALPDLRGRVPVGQGQGAGLSARSNGQTGGEETHTLLTAELPVHTHSLGAVGAPPANTAVISPSGNFVSVGSGEWAGGSGNVVAYSTATPDVTLNPGVISPSAGAAPHSNLMPYLALTPCIALNGIYPSQN